MQIKRILNYGFVFSQSFVSHKQLCLTFKFLERHNNTINLKEFNKIRRELWIF